MINIDSMTGQKALVTGARGFLGSHLCSRLLDMGVEVYGISRNPSNDPESKIHWCRGDFAELSSATKLIASIKPDVIFHLGGLVTALPDRELVLATMNSLLVSTVNTLLMAADVGCRRVLLAASLTEPTYNFHDPVPASPYAAAKWASNAYARMFHMLYQTPSVILRPFMTYGPEQSIQKLVPHVTLSLLRGEAPKLSSGEWKADWIYISDVIDAFVAAAQVRGIEGSTIDIGCGTLVSVKDLVNQIAQLTQSKVQPIFGALPDRPFEQVRTANSSEAYAKLGWKPKVDFNDGLRDTVDWYKRSLDHRADSERKLGAHSLHSTVDS